MSGTNTMCVATALLETGMVPMTEPVTELTLEAPAGLIRIRADCTDGKVTGVTFRNVPAFATHMDATVEVPQLGTVTVDVASGGMFYVIAAAERLLVVRPGLRVFAGTTIGQLSGPAYDPASAMRNVVTVATGAFDGER